MKVKMFILLMYLTVTFVHGEKLFPNDFKQSNSIIFSLFGAFATDLNINASSRFFDYYNIGYQRFFNRFGFSMSVKSLYLEKEDPNYGDYLDINYFDLSIKPIYIFDENSFLDFTDYLIYLFGVIVLKEEYIEKVESFDIKEFNIAQLGFGFGMEFRLFDHLSFFNEFCLYNTNKIFYKFDYKMQDDKLPLKPGMEFGIKLYL